MSDQEKFDVIIIGAGPAGIACAYKLAREGKNVLVIERGISAGSKNVTGGRLYTYALDLLEPGLWEEAILERKVTREQIMVVNGDRSIVIDYADPSFAAPGKMPQSYTILRALFDEWFASKAEASGAFIASGILVEDLIEENGKVIGVKAGDDKIYADLIIAADGVNSFMAQKAGLREDLKAQSAGVGVKEIIELPANIIEERFNLKNGEGAARMILGCTEGIHGGGFLYTNRESLSLGCVFMPEELAGRGRQIHEIFQELKNQPAIHGLIEGGSTSEYGAHLVSEEGYRGVRGPLYKDGILLIGDAAGFVINTGYSIRGIDLAILSGIAAANAVLSDRRVGPAYLEELKKLRLLPAMKAAEGYVGLLDNPRIYADYPRFATELFQNIYAVNTAATDTLKKSVKRLLPANDLSPWQIIKDGIRGYRAL